MKVPAAELVTRLRKFNAIMDSSFDGWRYVFIFNPVTAYYFTGTLQDGILFIQKDEIPIYFVRRSFERAKDESRFSEIVSMSSYSTIAEKLSINKYSKIYIDKQFVTMDVFSRFNKYSEFQNVESCDEEISKTMATKSLFEINMIKRAGDIQKQVLEEYMPYVLKAGMTEAEAGALLTSEILRLGGHAGLRVKSFGRELFFGNIAFGTNSLKRYAFDTPAGVEGNCPAAPFLGSPNKILEKDDLIYIDICCGVEGYLSSMTTLYSFYEVSDYIYEQQRRCKYIRDRIVESLKPSIIPEQIYNYIINNLHPALEGLFMGVMPDNSKFLGHGIGLYADEYPIIAKGFKEPLKENMAIAVESKVAIKGVGTIGVKNTYIVSSAGGVEVNGNNGEIIKLAP